jgi:hypothetical protein
MVQQLQTMVGQSVDVMTNPNEMTFERYERHGTLREAALYIGLAAVVAGIFSLGSGALGFLEGVVNALIGFFLFTWLVYFIGKQQGGTGTFDEVAYTFALFIAPLTIIRGLISILAAIPIINLLTPLLGLALLAVQAVFAFIAVRSSMNISDKRTAILTLGGAVIATFIVQIIAAMII